MSKVKIIVTSPAESSDKIRQALGEAGAGVIGEYDFCSTTIKSEGRFKPSDKANPYIGKVGQLETVEEDRIEVTCDRGIAKGVIAKLREAHPYEEPAIDIIPLIEESEL